MRGVGLGGVGGIGGGLDLDDEVGLSLGLDDEVVVGVVVGGWGLGLSIFKPCHTIVIPLLFLNTYTSLPYLSFI
jgi:hypothetical protein